MSAVYNTSLSLIVAILIVCLFLEIRRQNKQYAKSKEEIILLICKLPQWIIGTLMAVSLFAVVVALIIGMLSPLAFAMEWGADHIERRTEAIEKQAAAIEKMEEGK